MPMFDRLCEHCQRQLIDCLEPVAAPEVACPECGGATRRVWFGKPANVISDECDVTVTNGICNPDGTPRRYRSKSEMRAEAAARGLTNHVVHLGTRGGDKSPHTSRWI